ncbi:MAG TPA: hypothetical protein VHL31_08685 [Geminicoccus sp.]|uniref:hypothetical protein n=1 Tax=Geminicoccus sp. TaxID=2024832 RepID=UPI002E331612|nr:hypothetical protein [Geminicoccus sp.]HEX2526365.1 hypothetical protein [Geminicoccus sp.]
MVRKAAGQMSLAEAGLAKTIFDALNRQLERRGLVIKAGTTIDATLAEADVKRPPMREGKVPSVIRLLACPGAASEVSLAIRRTWRWIIDCQQTIDPSLQGLQPGGCSGGSDLIRKAILFQR